MASIPLRLLTITRYLAKLPLVGGVAARLERHLLPNPADRVAPELHVGSAHAGREPHPGITHRVSVADGLEFETTTRSFDLRPRDVTQTGEFALAVEYVVARLEAGEPILVHCREGRERAPTVAATALAHHRGWSFAEALARIRDRRRIVEPTPELRELAERYLEDS